MANIQHPRHPKHPDSAELAAQVLAGDVRALARTLTCIENETAGSEDLHARLAGRAGHARIVGFTGPPGAGKSTLIDAYLTYLRGRGERVAVLAVDPSSAQSHGALLGDRVRMLEHIADAGVFVRSVAARNHLGGLTPTAHRLLGAIEAAGWPTILVESVGTGQSERDVADLVDVNVVLCAPGLGDDIQAMKSGILETADLLVVNKADHPLADLTFRQLQQSLSFRTPPESGRVSAPPAVLKTIASSQTGVAELHAGIQAVLADKEQAPGRHPRGVQRAGRWLAYEAARRVRARVLDPAATHSQRIIQALAAGEISLDEAAEQVLRALSGRT